MKRIGRDLWLWAFYDFADSLGFVGLTFYFGLWFVADLGGSDLWMSGAVAASTVALLFTLPFLGHASDRMHRRIPFLTAMALLSIASLIGLGLVGGSVEVLTPGAAMIIILFYFFFQYFNQASFAFYNAFLRDLANDKRSVESVSGFGTGLGQIGNLVRLVIFFSISRGTFSLWGISGKPVVFIVAGLLFLVFSVPVFLFLREQRQRPETAATGHVATNLRETINSFRTIRRHKGVLPYLITYYLFADAVLTLSLFVTLYLQAVGNFGDGQTNVVLLIAALFTMIGAYTSPLFVRLFKGRKNAITVFISLWTIFIISLAVANSPVVFAIVAVLNGFAYGVLFSLSRAFYAVLVPAEKQAELFSVYVLFERAASIIGPLVWSGAALLFSSYGDDRYRFSMLALALIVVASLISFRWVPEPADQPT